MTVESDKLPRAAIGGHIGYLLRGNDGYRFRGLFVVVAVESYELGGQIRPQFGFRRHRGINHHFDLTIGKVFGSGADLGYFPLRVPRYRRGRKDVFLIFLFLLLRRSLLALLLLSFRFLSLFGKDN